MTRGELARLKEVWAARGVETTGEMMRYLHLDCPTGPYEAFFYAIDDLPALIALAEKRAAGASWLIGDEGTIVCDARVHFDAVSCAETPCTCPPAEVAAREIT